MTSTSKTSTRLLIFTLLCGINTTLADPAPAEAFSDSELDFFRDIPVALHSTRLEQPPRNAPVAVSVIDRETIVSSGAQDIPSVLRLVPGMQMGRVTGSRSTVALHGFSDRFQRGMQVLVDGRSVYDPGFGGVLWDDLAVALEDIERIEVIRGPASSLFGANAFAATINIITVEPAEQKGLSAKLAAGEQGYRRGFLRYGGGDEKLNYRVSANYNEDEGIETRYDDNQTKQLSLRGDYRFDSDDLLLFSAGLSNGPRDDGFAGDPTQPQRTIDNRSYYGQLKWTRIQAPGEEMSLQLYYNYLNVDDSFQTPFLSQMMGAPAELVPLLFHQDDQPLNMGFGLRSQRFDLEFQHILHPSESLRVVWGLGGRQDSMRSRDLIEGDGETQRNMARAFFNAEWQALDNLIINAGAMVEKYQGYTAKLSPRLSANFHLSPEQTLRLSGGRGIRMPALFEAQNEGAMRFRDGSILDIFYGSANPVNPETIDSLEIGYLGEFPEFAMTLDIRLFHNEVSGWIQQAMDPDYPEPMLSHPVEEVREAFRGVFVNANLGEYTTEGMELAIDLTPIERLRVRVAAAAVKTHAKHTRRFNPVAVHHSYDNTPSASLSMLASLRLPHKVDFSLAYYHVDEMNWLGEGDTTPGFHEWDMRLAKTFRLAGSKLRLAGIWRNISGEHKDFQRENIIGSQAIVELGLDFD